MGFYKFPFRHLNFTNRVFSKDFQHILAYIRDNGILDNKCSFLIVSTPSSYSLFLSQLLYLFDPRLTYFIFLFSHARRSFLPYELTS